MKRFLFAGLVLLAALGLSDLTAQISDATFGDLKGRQIGPAKMSGRISSIDAENNNPNVIWVGSAGGGVWKSENRGTSFKSVFDEYTQSIGTVKIDQERPDTVWVGTGEVWTRNSVSIGSGIYRTVNGGEKWEFKGLGSSERIARIIIHPDNPDVLYVAVLGALWGDSEDRGVYMTSDAGDTWAKLLYKSPSTGCSDLVMDPDNPEVLYAAMWDFRREAHFFRSGGPGSGIYKTTDGGQHWEEVRDGLPETTLGRIALAIHPLETDAVYAVVESEKSALYKIAIQGESWEKLSDQAQMGDRPFYYSLLVPDPVEKERIYKPGTQLWVSKNGGKRFDSPSVVGAGYHSDTHALWINPNNNKELYLGTDGGVYISSDKGNTWRMVKQLPVSQFYQISIDNQDPYWVYGGLQDNNSWRAPSNLPGGIWSGDWERIGFGDGFYTYADPDNPQITYSQYQGGRMYKFNHETGEQQYIKPFPEEGTDDLRFNWDAPVIFGAKTNWLYAGPQYLYRSKDRGDTWERISPDLTTNDPWRQRQEQTGGLTIDNSTAENNTCILSVAESPLNENIIWVGTDDGNVQLSRDGGKSWTLLNANIPGLPEKAFISEISPGRNAEHVAYMTVDAHRDGNMNPYVYFTSDYGQSWKSLITDDLDSYCHTIKQDLVNPDLLFLGTEFGLFISLDNGTSWKRFKNKVPKVGIHDIAIHPGMHDVILGTHGRGIIIIDDISPLRALTDEKMKENLAFLPLRPFNFHSGINLHGYGSNEDFVGPNYGNLPRVAYHLKKRHLFGDLYMEIYDEEGQFIKKVQTGGRKGINIVAIPLNLDPPRVPKSPVMLGQAAFGPSLQEGTYKLKIIKGKASYETELVLGADPRQKHSSTDRKLRFKTLMRAYNMLEELADIDEKLLAMQTEAQLELDRAKSKRAKRKIQEKVDEYSSVHESISATQAGESGIPGQIRLREKIAEVYSALGAYKGAPSNLQMKALDLYQKEVESLGRWIN
ncbi:MAG: glycosyl hydrolase [Bacteroidota bacterium]|nr:glycosyl hydrolase [Bacteroidota bacterium]